MVAMRSTILFYFVASLSSVLAMPPACLLAAVNTQPNPANLTAVCGSGATNVQKAIASMCGSNVAVAESAFASTCSSAGKTVPTFAASSAISSTVSSKPSNSANGTFVYTTASFDSSCSCTKTVVTSATGAVALSSLGLTASSVTATGSATQTFSTASASATAGANGAALIGMQQSVGTLVAAVIAVAGVVAAL